MVLFFMGFMTVLYNKRAAPRAKQPWWILSLYRAGVSLVTLVRLSCLQARERFVKSDALAAVLQIDDAAWLKSVPR